MSKLISADQFLQQPVGYGLRASDKQTPARPLARVLEMIGSPDAKLTQSIERCRLQYAELECELGLLGFPQNLDRTNPEHDRARKLKAAHVRTKAGLPYFTVSGTWPGEDRRDASQLTHTSLFIADLDHLSRADLDPADVRAQAADLPYVLASFISPSGDGVKVIIVMLPAPSPGDRDGHGWCWDQSSEALARDLGIPVDPDPKNRNPLRLCYLPDDPGIHVADEIGPLQSAPKPKAEGKGRRKGKSTTSEHQSGFDPRPAPEEWERACPDLGLQRTHTGLVGPCPACGGEDRFHVDLAPPHGWGCRRCTDRGETFAPYWAAFPGRRHTGDSRSQNPQGPAPESGDGHMPHPWIHPSDPWDPWRCTPDADCARTIRRHAGKLLAVEDFDGRITLRVARRSGTWSRAYADLDRLVVETQIEWAKVALERLRDPKEVGNIAKWAAKTEAQRGRDDALASAGRVIIEMRERGSLPEALTQCMEWELDADARYLGVNNGVLDLGAEPGNELLTGMPARRCLVTRSTSVNYRPEAQHDLVDALTAHLDPEDREYILDALAFSLWARPSRRIYFLCGEHNGGKSTLLAAARSSIGDTAMGGYGMQIQGHALMRSRFQTPNDHAGNLFGVQNARIGTISEIPKGRESFNGPLIKQLVGGDGLNLRDVREKSSGTRPARATLFVALNPPDMERLDSTDRALNDRVYILPYPQLPEKLRDKRVVTQVQEDPAIREAMIAMMVARCLGKTAPPVPPGSVLDAGMDRHVESIGPVGQWAVTHLVVTLNRRDKITTDDLIEALGQDVQTDADGLYDGMPRREVLSLIRSVVDGMPAASVVTVDGRNKRGYIGVRLATPEEVEEREPAETSKENEREEEHGTQTRNPGLKVAVICLDCGRTDLDENTTECPGCGCTAHSRVPWADFWDRVRASLERERVRRQALSDLEDSLGRPPTMAETSSIEDAFFAARGYAYCASCHDVLDGLTSDAQAPFLCEECEQYEEYHEEYQEGVPMTSTDPD